MFKSNYNTVKGAGITYIRPMQKKEKGSRGEREVRVCLSFNLTYFVVKVLKKNKIE